MRLRVRSASADRLDPRSAGDVSECGGSLSAGERRPRELNGRELAMWVDTESDVPQLAGLTVGFLSSTTA